MLFFDFEDPISIFSVANEIFKHLIILTNVMRKSRKLSTEELCSSLELSTLSTRTWGCWLCFQIAKFKKL